MNSNLKIKMHQRLRNRLETALKIKINEPKLSRKVLHRIDDNLAET